MLMDKTCKVYTIPNIDKCIVQKSYLPWNIHYGVCFHQKLLAGTKLAHKEITSDMYISLNPFMTEYTLFLLNIC